MIIEFEQQYYSLGPFKSDELTNFTIITGKNGSGKSQLIELLRFYTNNNNQVRPTLTPSIDPHRIQFEQLETTGNKGVDIGTWREKARIVIEVIQNKQKLKLNHKIHEKGLTYDSTENYIELFKDDKDFFDVFVNVTNSLPLRYVDPKETAYYNNIDERKKVNNIIQLVVPYSFFKFVADYKNKSVLEIDMNDVYSSPIPDDFINKNIFTLQFEDIFYAYAKRRFENFMQYSFKENGLADNNSIPDKEFVSIYRPPWDFINDILQRNNSKYSLKGIKLEDYSTESHYDFFFIKEDGTEVRFDKLSSGERIIFGLIFKIFFVKYYGEKAVFPELLILDEPDAHLHPEMTKLLIDVLNDGFVKDLGMKVIITTHSPSTVALAPDDSIYELKNEPVTTLKKINKDDALKILTGNIPTLNIDYKSHKQVFVESPTDRGYYNNIYLKHKANNSFSHPLYFLCNDYGKGSSTQVLKVVSDLVKSGSNSIWGIIDWDNSNKEDLDNHIIIHGDNERYSIESYLFDPLYLAALFIDTNANNICAELKIDKGITNPYNIGQEDDKRLQEIADWIIGKFEAEHGKNENERKTIHYLNGRSITIPKWLWGYNGHDFWQKFQGVFKSLEKYKKDVEMAVELSEVAARCYPLVSIDTIKIIEQLAK